MNGEGVSDGRSIRDDSIPGDVELSGPPVYFRSAKTCPESPLIRLSWVADHVFEAFASRLEP